MEYLSTYSTWGHNLYWLLPKSTLLISLLQILVCDINFVWFFNGEGVLSSCTD